MSSKIYVNNYKLTKIKQTDISKNEIQLIQEDKQHSKTIPSY